MICSSGWNRSPQRLATERASRATRRHNHKRWIGRAISFAACSRSMSGCETRSLARGKASKRTASHRHSGATRQRVGVARRGAAIQLAVSDDGRGFEPERVLAREVDVGVEGGHFGLRGIQDRVEMLGGSLTIDSAPGRGTELAVTLPAE